MKIAASWFLAAVGLFAGLIALARSGMMWVPLDTREPGWLLPWLSVAGSGLFGLGFVVASIVASKNPKRAGLMLLFVMPVAAFCLAYPESYFLVWHSDGSGWYERPLPLTAIGLTALCFLPLLATLFAFHSKKQTAIVLGATTLLVAPVFVYSRWTVVMLPQLLVYSAPFLLFAAFWLVTQRLGWPTLVLYPRRNTIRRVGAIAVTCSAVLCLDLAMTLALTALTSSLFNGDCREKQPFTEPESPRHAVFTARATVVGRSITELAHEKALAREGWGRSGNYPVRAGEWAIGTVQETFWGIPTHWPHLVLMTNFVYRQGETYFIDGERGDGLLTRILPIVGAGIGCSRSRLVQDATIDLHLLRESKSAGTSFPNSR